MELKCKHEGCENPVTEVLVAQPSPEMILDGDAAAHFLCGQDGHKASGLLGAIQQYDKNAQFLTFYTKEPVSFGQSFAALATGTGS